MARFGLAIKVFFRILRNGDFARQVQDLVEGKALPAPAPTPARMTVAPTPAPAPLPKAPAGRSEALTVLAVLQREARFVDFIKEPLASYSDAQIGAAVRDIHRDCGAAIERMFALQPVMQQAEGSAVQVPAGFDAARIRLTGNVSGQPPFRGTLRHQGWEASKVQLPEWSGSAEAARVVAPAEVEL